MLIDEAYRKYSDGLQNTMSRFSRDEAAAKDAVSQAFTQALVNRRMLESMHEQAMKAWLYTAARNALTDMKRKESRFSELTDIHQADTRLPEDTTNRVMVESMMKQLPSDLSLPIYMKYYMGYNATEIGNKMELPPATVRTRIRTALGLMRSMMKGN